MESGLAALLNSTTVLPIKLYFKRKKLLMPELPDIEVFTRNIKIVFANKTVERVELNGGKNIKDSPGELSDHLVGKKLMDVYRSGKEFSISVFT